ncbi:hypothetical protein CWB96_10700 [Pseudoalteromonas citrea]|uniref:Uncharacterized protein n=1 Tax=Pseudoalteromonas citrea TaxID=43655 RepID=A0A5S3XR22_9GAMM|nr:hypothetical protein [Pseudoalteromonas citrea]TMP45646.1 hypothetical protein CWB97_03345 [Pseudoalteromonas citrea]TMP59026.1 hypothetical protein CWB96_10700 [Pseudoalteromonas citrea]
MKVSLPHSTHRMPSASYSLHTLDKGDEVHNEIANNSFKEVLNNAHGSSLAKKRFNLTQE